MKNLYLGICLSICLGIQTAQSQVTDTIGNTVVKIDSLIGFSYVAQDWPWDLCWGPDQSLWFTVGDKVCRYDTTTHIVTTVLNRPDTTSNAMSVAFHPNFASNPVVYVTYDVGNYYYAYSAGPIMLFKYDYSITGDSLYNETVILSWTHAGEHAGGRIYMGQDNYLYCVTAEYWPVVDTVGNLNGRVLRINPDGSIPIINSHGNYPISYGHRNPQGIVQVPNGNIIISELGQQIDELNLIRDYKNYGWPAFDGDLCFGGLPDSCTSPTFVYESPIDTAIRPPSGIDYYDHPAIPELQGCILQSILSFGGYQGGMVASKLNASMDDVVSDVHYFKGEYFRWRDVCVSPDGKIFAITNDRQLPVIRVIYNPNYHIGLEAHNSPAWQVYPNPAFNLVTITSPVTIQHWEIKGYDGKVIETGTPGNGYFFIDLSALASGVYFLTTNLGTKKIVKQ
jgi:glucose/arabinose dehydrogenase